MINVGMVIDGGKEELGKHRKGTRLPFFISRLMGSGIHRKTIESMSKMLDIEPTDL